MSDIHTPAPIEATAPATVPAAEPPGVPPTTSVPIEVSTPLKEPLRLALFALGIGGVFDLLFRGGDTGLGINGFLFVILLLGTFYFLAKREQRPSNKRTVAFLVTPLLFFAAMLAIRASANLASFNSVACIALWLLLLRAWNRDLVAWNVGELFAAPWKGLGGTLTHAPDVTRTAAAQVSVDGERKSRIAAVLRGVLFAIPALIAFTWLFSSADARFGNAVTGTLEWLFPADFAEQLPRFGWVLAMIFACTGGIGYALTHSEGRWNYVVAPPRPKPLGFTEAMIVLGSVIGLFAAFLVMQATYLFGGNAHVQTVPDLTYAEYARHGFAELNIVAVLTLLLVTLLKAITRRDTHGKERGFAASATTLLVLSLPLLVSAFQRMQAYETAYGATELRLYVDLFIGWLAVGLIWCGAMLWRKDIGSGLGVYICVTGFLVSLNIINPDAAVARRNIERYRTGHTLDIDYLASLSDDAVPEIVPLLRSSPEYHTAIENHLRKISQGEGAHHNGAAWNLSRFRAEQTALQIRLNDSE